MLAAVASAGSPPAAQTADPAIVALPNRPGSLKFAVLGDFGTGGRRQLETAQQMIRSRVQFPYQLAITVGDNIYGSERPSELKRKFEVPYKALLDGGVKFYASLGNHDSREQRHYPPFNMNGQAYYTLKAPAQDVRFFALDSSFLDQAQISWLTTELGAVREKWKILYFHHPVYSSARRHGSEPGLRDRLEPLIVKFGVSVVFAGHDHVYERTAPQQGVVHFVVGSGGQLRRGNINRASPVLARAFDADRAFLLAEIEDDRLVFNAVSREGMVVDSGAILRPGSEQPAR